MKEKLCVEQGSHTTDRTKGVACVKIGYYWIAMTRTVVKHAIVVTFNTGIATHLEYALAVTKDPHTNDETSEHWRL